MFIFTTNDNPHKGSADLVKQARVRALEYYENDIQIQLMHILDREHREKDVQFDVDLFYSVRVKEGGVGG